MDTRLNVGVIVFSIIERVWGGGVQKISADGLVIALVPED